MIFHYGQDQLSISTALAIAKGACQAVLGDAQRTLVNESHSHVRRIAAGDKAVYGINTGFGPLCATAIPAEAVEQLQYNLLVSHSMGTGAPISLPLAKLMLILKAHALSQGYSGVRPLLIDRIIWHIEQDVLPRIPKQGSVGASGDLAPLSHCFLPLIGLGELYHEGQWRPASEVLAAHGLAPLQLGAKEGLALINGTQFIAAHAVLAVDRLENCLDTADIAAALMIEALHGSAKPFEARLHRMRPFPGNQIVAAKIYGWLRDSPINLSHRDCQKVQDPYSLRCVPQVHGASRDAWAHLKERTEIEINSVTDNPLVFEDGETISGGNFHGQPLAMTLDYAGLAASELGNISDRRIYLSLEGKSEGVPKLLMEDLGLNSGFMILQYSSAALASENKTLCFPASADSIPTSLGQEDHVSMGSISGRKTLHIISNLEKILAIELIAACQALDFRRPLLPHPALAAVRNLIRQHIDFATHDRLFYPDIEACLTMVREGKIVEATRKGVKV